MFPLWEYLEKFFQKAHFWSMNWRDHIISDQDVLLGKPTLKDRGLSVEHIVGLLALSWLENKLLENYPRLTKPSLQAVLAYLQELYDGRAFILPARKSA
jgi:uncharacterized protein (DUF433 family)